MWWGHNVRMVLGIVRGRFGTRESGLQEDIVYRRLRWDGYKQFLFYSYSSFCIYTFINLLHCPFAFHRRTPGRTIASTSLRSSSAKNYFVFLLFFPLLSCLCAASSANAPDYQERVDGSSG